jgi:hypothetical protein
MTLFILHRPSSTLHPYVSGYWRVSDRAGAYRGRPIDTAPRPGAVLTVNIGQPNRSSDGDLTPTLSLLGVQTQARSWRSDFDTDFIMALLTPLGLARLFPGCASGVANSLVDAGSVVGDRAAAALLNEASARPDSLVAALDEWLLARLTAARVTGSIDLFQAASRELANASRVSVAAETLGVTRRHLSRLVREHLGIGPKDAGPIRTRRSLTARRNIRRRRPVGDLLPVGLGSPKVSIQTPAFSTKLIRHRASWRS